MPLVTVCSVTMPNHCTPQARAFQPPLFDAGALHGADLLSPIAQHGVVQIMLPQPTTALNEQVCPLNKDAPDSHAPSQVFAMSQQFFQLPEDHPRKRQLAIDHQSGSLSGYHALNGLGGNNKHRLGAFNCPLSVQHCPRLRSILNVLHSG